MYGVKHYDGGQRIESKLCGKMGVRVGRTRIHSVPTVDSILREEPWSGHEKQDDHRHFPVLDGLFLVPCYPFLFSRTNPAHHSVAGVTHFASNTSKTTVGTLCIRVLVRPLPFCLNETIPHPE